MIVSLTLYRNRLLDNQRSLSEGVLSLSGVRDQVSFTVKGVRVQVKRKLGLGKNPMFLLSTQGNVL